MWAPLWIAGGWLLGTFASFWLTGFATKVENPGKLITFVLATVAVFCLGYALRILRYPTTIHVEPNRWDRQKQASRLVVASAIYLATFGVAQILEYGGSGFGDILARIQNPGAAYQAKFAVYELQEATNRVSRPVQVLTLAGGLCGVLGPMLVIYWQKLTFAVRVCGVGGLAVYALFFLFIGTQKGLGDIVVMLLAAALAGTFGTWWSRGGSQATKRKMRRYALAAAFVLLCYMISAQAERVEVFGTQDVVPANPIVAAVVGKPAATGIAALTFYPTHGYLGLSYNLDQPLVWTKGMGAAPVVASYAQQYLGTAPPQTYPVRTELATGWPAGQLWATAYPWLASDLTFPGAVAAMGVLGWFFARMWVEGAIMRDGLALVIFGQLAIGVAYVPANNQIGQSRPVLIGFFTLVAIYMWRSVTGRSDGKLLPVSGE